MAAYAIQFRRGTTTQHNSFTGLLGEVTVDTDKKTLVVHDGSTTGGFPLAREGAASNASTGSFTSNVTVGGTLAVTSTASFSDDVTITGDLGMTGHIIPSANITYDLGSPTMMWRDIYVGPGSLYVNGKKVIEDNNGSINFTTDTNETLKIVVPGATGTLQFSAGSLQLDGEINAITGDITFGDHLDMNSNRIKNVSAPVEGADATNKTYVDTKISSELSGGTLAVDATTGDFSGDVAIGGSLTVTGTVTTVNSETIELADNILLLNSNALGNASQSGGIEVERGDDLNVQLLWDETNDRWSVGAEDFKAATFIGNLTGDVTGTVSSLANHDTADLSETATYRYYTPARETAMESYVDTEISTLSATVAAGSYGDSDVLSYLGGTTNVGTIKGNIEIDQNKSLSIFGRGSSKGRIFVEAELSDGSDVDFDLLGFAGTGNAYPTLRAYQFEPIDGQTDIILQPGGSGGNVMVSNRRIQQLANPSNNDDAANKAYVDSEISTLSATVAAGAYSDSDLTDYLANNQTSFANIRANTTAATVGTWADPFGQVNGKTIGLTEAIVWPSAASEHGSYKLVELVGQTGTGTIHAEFFPDVIKPGYSTGGNNVKLEPNAGGVVDVSNSKISNVSTPTDTTDAANKAYVDQAEVDANAYTDTRETAITTAYEAYADQAEADAITAATNLVTNATGSNLSLANKSTSDLAEGSNEYFTPARAVAAVEASLTHFHSAEQTVTAAVSTANATASVSYTFAELEGADHYAVYLNRQLLRPGEFTANGNATNNLTISTGILAEDDELEVVGFKL